MIVVFLSILVTSMLVATGTSVHYARKARRAIELTKVPEALPLASKHQPELPTRNDRWVMEQEHILYPNRTHAQLKHVGCRVCGPGPLRKYELPSAYDHIYYKDVTFRGAYEWRTTKQKVGTPSEADVISSEIEGHSGWHTPMIDLDQMPVRVIESSTPGNYHLYIDKPMKWKQYRRLLDGLLDSGLIEKAFYDSAVGNHNTQLRPPWVEKE